MKVIVAVDQTDYAEQVLDMVSKRRWPKDTSFKLLTVLEPLPFEWEPVNSFSWKSIAQEIFAKRSHDAGKMLESARQKIVSTVADCHVHIEIRHGQPRVQIVDAAAEWSANKIVLGAHGHSPNRLFPGTTSRAVACQAICSVDLVRLVDHPAQNPVQNSDTAVPTAHSSKAFAG